MAKDAVATLSSAAGQNSGNALELKLVGDRNSELAEAPKLTVKDRVRLEAADDLDDLWDNVPI